MLKEKLIYIIDNAFAKGSISLVWILMASSILIIVLTAIIAWIIDFSSEPSLIQNIWKYTLGIVINEYEQGDILSLFIVICGMLITSVLIGIVTTGIHNKYTELSKGKTRVVEKNHTVILGWSPYIFRVISEICEANKNQKKGCIVILANEFATRIDMERRIKLKVNNIGNTKIICRIGSPIDMDDINKTSTSSAKSVIVLSKNNKDDHDAIRTILALTKNQNKESKPDNIVAFINDENNLAIKDLIAKEKISLLHAESVFARIIVQACRDPGLSLVYSDLLDYAGDEIYFKHEAKFIGEKFYKTFSKYNDSIVIGIHSTKNKKSLLSPDFDYIIKQDDQLIVISEDDDTIHLSEEKHEIDLNQIVKKDTYTQKPDNILILGYNELIKKIIKGLDNYSAKNSTITIIDEDIKIKKEKLNIKTINQKIIFREGQISNRKFLNSIDFKLYDTVVVLPDLEFSDYEQADTRSLITLLHLRDIIKTYKYSFEIITLIINSKNKKIIENETVSDFVVSSQLFSLLLSQISEKKELAEIFEDLFTETGVQVHFKNIKDYIKLDKSINFHTITQSAINKNEIAIGYRKNKIIKINPSKDNLIEFSEGDQLIVLTK